MSPILDRRSFLTSTVAFAASLQLQQAAYALGFSQTAPVCRLVAEQEEGPYYIGGEALRSDVTEGKAGVPLDLNIALLDARTCKPLTGATVDMWSCDALGLYAGFTKQNPMGPGGPPPPGADPQHPHNRPGSPEGFGPPPQNHPTDKLTFLRGVQVTDANGMVHFRTIVPGFYEGRTNHIHFKVRTGGGKSGLHKAEGHVSHTGQVFLPEELMVELMRQPPYSEHRIHRTTANEDAIFTDQHGDTSVARVVPSRDGTAYSAELIAVANPDATPSPAMRKGGPPPQRAFR